MREVRVTATIEVLSNNINILNNLWEPLLGARRVAAPGGHPVSSLVDDLRDRRAKTLPPRSGDRLVGARPTTPC